MKIRKIIPRSQLIDNTGVLVSPGWLLAGLSIAGAAKAIEPPFEIFYPPTAAPFGAGWTLSHFLSSSWAVILVILMLAGGLLGDLFGRRKVLLWGIGAMLLSNSLLLLSLDSVWHLVWRILALSSAGIILPLTLAPIYVFFEYRQRAVAYAIYLTSIAIAGFLATYQGRFFTQHLDWRFSYLLPALLSVVAFIFVRRSLPESRSADPRLMDVIVHSGWTILVLAIIYALFVVVVGSDWMIIVTIITFVGLVVGLLLITWWRWSTRDSLLRTRVIDTRHVTVFIISGVIIQITLIGAFSVTYSYYRVGHNFNFMQTLLALSPMFLGMVSAIFLIARIWANRQVRQVTAISFMFVSAAIATLAIAANLPYWVQVLPLVLFGTSIIGIKTIWTNAFFQTLIDRYIGLNAGIISATLLVGGALGSFLTTGLLAQFGQSAFVRQSTSLTLSQADLESIYNDITAAVTAGEQAGLENLALMVSSSLYAWYQDAYIVGYSLTLLVIALLCVLVILLSVLGIRAKLKFHPEDMPLDDDDPGEVVVDTR